MGWGLGAYVQSQLISNSRDIYIYTQIHCMQNKMKDFLYYVLNYLYLSLCDILLYFYLIFFHFIDNFKV